jgi:predicted XRE-type DNA-binding protein
MKMTKSSGNVFADLGFDPEEAANLALRSELMIYLKKIVEKNGLTQSAAAKRFGVTQPRLNQLLKGKIELFSVDALVNMLARAGYTAQIKVTAPRRSRHVPNKVAA